MNSQKGHPAKLERSRGFIVPLIIAIVTVLVIGGGAYIYKTQKVEAPVVNTNSATSTLVGNDRDAHGCIGSAGYSWCAEKSKCLRVWEEKCEATTTDVTKGWETYTDAQYGFSVKYPNIFPPEVSKDNITSSTNIIFHQVGDPNLYKGFFQVVISDNNQWGLSDQCNEIFLTTKKLGDDCSEACNTLQDTCEVSQIDNIKVFKVGIDLNDYLINYRNKWLFIRTAFSDQTQNDQILSTFKFTK